MRRLRAFWRFLNLPCRHFAHLASESLDHELSHADRTALSLHALYCWACRRYIRQIHFLRELTSQLSRRLESDEPVAGPALPTEVRERIQRSLREG
jgi:hypothetical protein